MPFGIAFRAYYPRSHQKNNNVINPLKHSPHPTHPDSSRLLLNSDTHSKLEAHPREYFMLRWKEKKKEIAVLSLTLEISVLSCPRRISASTISRWPWRAAIISGV